MTDDELDAIRERSLDPIGVRDLATATGLDYTPLINAYWTAVGDLRAIVRELDRLRELERNEARG